VPESRALERPAGPETLDARHRQREEELRLANERFALAAAAIGGAIYDWNVQAGVLEWSDGIQRVFGYPPAEVEPTLEWWADRLHPEDRLRVTTQLGDDLRAGRDVSAEYRFRAHDGRYLPVWDRGQGVRDAAGRIVRVVGVMENVAALKSLEEQLRQVQKMEAVGLLAGGVAHDFNNLLTTILGYSDLLLATLPEGSRHRQQVQEIHGASQRAAGLTRQLLAFSRREVAEPRVLDLNAVVGNVERMLRRVIGEDIRLVTDLDPAAAKVRADRGQIEQLLMNVVVNSRDAMPRGGSLVISTCNRLLDADFVGANPGARAGDHAVIEIVDTGCGMDESVRAHVFDPFFTTKPPGRGTGLGMAIVYGVVKTSGGYVRVDSALGRGTTVTIYLPALPATEAALEPPAALTAAGGGHETVLVVEDEEVVARLVGGLLRASGYRVLQAAAAETALELEESHAGAIDLVLTDVVMPGMSGRELAERMHVRRPQARVLLMSGYAADRVVPHDARGHATGLLAKPFTADALLRTVRAALGDQAAPAVASA
jgi:PAS domain S-box-containing protein